MGAVQQQLEQALELVREHHDGLASVRIQRFFSCYYAGLAPDDLESRSCEDLYGGALSHWRLVESRLPGAPAYGSTTRRCNAMAGTARIRW